MRAVLVLLAMATTARAEVAVGKVVAPDGKPVGNAAIHVMLWFVDGTGAEQRDVVAKADGSFAVADSTYGSPVKIVSLAARADGFTASDDTRPAPGAVGVTIALRPAATVVLRVVDAETGAPVGHASITPSNALHPSPTQGGVATFANVDAKANTWYAVAAPGYQSESVWPTYQLGGDQVALRRRWPLALRLLDLAGRPYAHCAITLDHEREEPPALTDARGNVTLLAPHGDVAFDPACSHVMFEEHQVKHVAGGGVQTLRLPPNQVFAGKVLDTAGKPVAGATVHFRGDEGQDILAVVTDARGAFRFDTFRVAHGFMVDADTPDGRRSADEHSVGDDRHPITIVVGK